jgi:DNA-binding MarR family transcriptional regulator
MEGDPAAELPLAQLQVCSLLFETPRAMTVLSRELKVSLSAMTQLADRMERAGLVQRVIGGADRRVRKLQLTPRGEKILRYREEARLEQVMEILRQLSPKKRRQVLSALRMLLSACELKKNDHQPAVLAGNG